MLELISNSEWFLFPLTCRITCCELEGHIMRHSLIRFIGTSSVEEYGGGGEMEFGGGETQKYATEMNYAKLNVTY